MARKRLNLNKSTRRINKNNSNTQTNRNKSEFVTNEIDSNQTDQQQLSTTTRIINTNTTNTNTNTTTSAINTNLTQVTSILEPEEYEVQEIVGKYNRKGSIFYCVKWKGYPDSENSWINVKNLNCPRLLVKYERKAEKEHEEILAKRFKKDY